MPFVVVTKGSTVKTNENRELYKSKFARRYKVKRLRVHVNFVDVERRKYLVLSEILHSHVQYSQDKNNMLVMMGSS